jgi:hypothetical protein
MQYVLTPSAKLLLLASCLFFQSSKAQSYRTQQNQMLAYNVLSNGLMGGIGGLINRKPGEKWHQVFLKNFGKGCLGGLIKHSAKMQTYYLQYPQNNFLAIPNRLYYFLGHSMVMNASANKKLLSTYHCNLMGMDIRWHAKDSASKARPFEVRLSVQSVISVGSMMRQGHQLDLYRSLEMGLFYFDMDSAYRHPVTRNAAGISDFNSIVIGKQGFGGVQSFVIPHEVVHVYQQYDLYPLRNFFYPRYLEKPLMKNKVYNTLSKYLVSDLESYLFVSAYALQPQPVHYKNFYEYEAQHFGGRQYIYR